MKHLLYITTLLLFLSSCRTVRESSSTKVNIDSLSTHIRDSMTRVLSSESSELRRMIDEMTSSGVTFVTVDSCPERDLILNLLDSAGKERYKAIMLEEKVKQLSSKVTISEKGVITAEGQIKAAYFTSSRLENELLRVEKTNDSLRHVISTDSSRYALQITEDTSKKKTSTFPWWMVWAAGAAGIVLGWIARWRLTKSRFIGRAK